ncbi:hypothetical protein FT663_01390 [Candidozyma haemuli var. vulneris]|nr:hypothetical protein FT662_01071 [[Candida] haemuloni var. vulneris]KAF3994477.1 hypothetical protein FT663_01390 [[Candida] haemuloni var. vulneris]
MLFFIYLGIQALAFQFLDSGISSYELSTEIYQSQCAHRALEDVIEECASGGVESLSSALRKKSAVDLSVCEFQDAAIDYPESCKRLDTDSAYHNCIQELRQTSQYWTTYSGNYRRIKSICHEEAMPFFKEHLVDLFNNVTRTYTSFHEASFESTKETERYQKEVQLQFEKMLAEVMEMVSVSRKHREDWEAEAMAFNEELESIFSNVQGQVHHEFDHLASSINSLSKVANNQADLVGIHADEETARLNEASSLWTDFKGTLHEDILEILEAMKDIQTQTSLSQSNQLALHDTLQGELQLTTEFQHRLRSIEFDLQQYFDTQSTELESFIEATLLKFGSMLNTSVQQLETSHASLRDNVYDLNEMLAEQKDSVNQVFANLTTQIKITTNELKKRSLFNPISILLSLSSTPVTVLTVLGCILIFARNVPRKPFKAVYEFFESFMIGLLVTILVRLLWKYSF